MRWVLAIACVACGRIGFDPDALPPPFQSGTRLRAEVYRTPEGVDLATRYWWDSELQTYCTMYGLLDGGIACLPDEAALYGAFADPGCTQPAARWDAAHCDPPKFAINFDTSDEYTLGDPVAQAYDGVPGSCVPISPSASFWSVVGLAPASRFVNGTVVSDVAPGLGTQRYVMDDGTTEQRAVMADGVQCPLELDVGQSDPVCIDIPYVDTYYTDAACTDRIYGSAPQPVSAFAIFGATPCERTSYVTAAAALQPPAVYQLLNGTCMPASTGAGWFFRAGSSVAPGTLPTGRFVESGAGRVVYRYWQSGQFAFAFEVWDRWLGTPCRPALADDQTWRCLPAELPFSGYLDASCTMPANFGFGCAGPAFDVSLVTTLDACGEGVSVVHSTTPAAVYTNFLTPTCTKAGDGFVSTGVEVPATMFEQLDRRIE